MFSELLLGVSFESHAVHRVALIPRKHEASITNEVINKLRGAAFIGVDVLVEASGVASHLNPKRLVLQLIAIATLKQVGILVVHNAFFVSIMLVQMLAGIVVEYLKREAVSLADVCRHTVGKEEHASDHQVLHL